MRGTRGTPCKGWETEALEQGLCEDARAGVRGAGLPEWGSGSAVFLIHTEVSRRAAEEAGIPPGATSKTGCYHTRSVNVL